MQKAGLGLIIILLSSINSYSQDTDYIKLIRNDFRSIYKNKKTIRHINDSIILWVEYSKKTGQVLSIEVDRKGEVGTYGSFLTIYNFGTNGKVWMRVLVRFPVVCKKCPVGTGEYYYINDKLVAKEINKYIEKDYSYLISEAQFYKSYGLQLMKDRKN